MTELGFYEFFAGGGMVRAALGAEWHCLMANDICHKKARSYADNWGSYALRIEDIFKLTPADLPGQADLAWGSFPCQDLSLAGARAGLDGERSGAFWGFWNLMQGLAREHRKPRVIVLENVYGALSSHDGRDFDTIATALAGAGYVFGAMILDAVHFLPQSRPRLFVVALDAAMAVPDILHGWTTHPAWHPAAIIRAHNRLSPNVRAHWRWWSPPLPQAPVVTLDSLIESEPQGVDWHTPEVTTRLLESMSDINRQKLVAAQRGGQRTIGAIYRRTRGGVVRAEARFDGLSGCLRTPTGGSSRQTLIVVEGASIRTRLISPRETARLMGLPDDYRLPERYNDAYHLAGDGVAVPVVRHLARTLIEPLLAANAQTRREAA
jgi:DNA (cytosine-5)-methyltransferase 1